MNYEVCFDVLMEWLIGLADRENFEGFESFLLVFHSRAVPAPFHPQLLTAYTDTRFALSPIMSSSSSEDVVVQCAQEMPSYDTVELRMVGLHLHSSGVFSNVYRGFLMDKGARRDIAIKKTWPGDKQAENFEKIFLSGVSRPRHKNIVQMLYVFKNKLHKTTCLSFIFDFMPSTLDSVIKTEVMHPLDIKLYTWQLFNGLRYLQSIYVIHRDIKPQNILIDCKSGLLKISDFGSAKILRHRTRSTNYQVTRFYRPPELLLEATYYSHMVDVWSAGCVLGEMLKGSVLFPGRDVRHELRLIFTTLGSPSEADMRAMHSNIRLDGTPVPPGSFETLMPDVDKVSVQFLSKILIFPPRQRLCSKALLLHEFFAPLFNAAACRPNGQLISSIITPQDLQEVKDSTHKKIKTFPDYVEKRSIEQAQRTDLVKTQKQHVRHEERRMTSA